MRESFTIEDVRSFWDGVANVYEATNEKVGYVHTQRFEKAIEFGQIQPQQHVLNIWSRTGNLIPYLRRVRRLSIENREVSPELIRIAKKKYPGEHFALTDLEDLSEFSRNTFDRVISLETLEHTPQPQKFLRELQRILKPGGLLILSTPPRGCEVTLYVYELFLSNHGEGPHRFPWPGEVKKWIKEGGFQLLSHHPYIIFPLLGDTLSRLSERVLTALFGWTPLAIFGYRHFFVARKAKADIGK